MQLVALVCFALVPMVLCEELPVISNISKEQTKSIGEEVEFNCTVQNDKNYSVLWYKIPASEPNSSYREKPQSVPLYAGDHSIIRDERFSIAVDNKTSTYTLKIKNLQESDTGFYQCQILISVNDRPSAEVELQIRRPPTISRNTTQSVNVTEGWPFELHCYADGFPVPRISWKRDGDVLLSTGGSIFRGNVLKILQANKDDRGLYHCVAENGVGTEARANASVRVEFKPVITAVRPRVGQSLGYDIGLECKIEAYPAPVVSWYKKGAELKKEQIKSSGDEFVDTLHRYSVGSSDYGEYVCRAENKHGSDETKLDLFETIVPVCDTACG